jgi:hypothetical protein
LSIERPLRRRPPAAWLERRDRIRVKRTSG